DRLVRVLCKGRCSERGRRTHLSWAAVQQPFPDPEVIRWATIRLHLHDYTAECPRCGSLARDPYGWLWPRTPRHRPGVSDLGKRLAAMTSGAMSMSLTKQSHRKGGGGAPGQDGTEAGQRPGIVGRSGCVLQPPARPGPGLV